MKKICLYEVLFCAKIQHVGIPTRIITHVVHIGHLDLSSGMSMAEPQIASSAKSETTCQIGHDLSSNQDCPTRCENIDAKL